MTSPISAAVAATTPSSPSFRTFDVTVVCTTDDEQASYWTSRLSSGILSSKKSSSDGPFPLVLAVSEDWSAGGAGNGLGTLYAFEKACKVASEKHGVDVAAEMAAGRASVGLYHTAGKGTRLAPLPGGENNNKPGVKLPPTHEVEGMGHTPITILEAVIRQTSIYSSTRAGRLSVFWGDQVFIPTAPFNLRPTHHADIMCTLGSMPDAATWASEGLDKYGVIAVSADGSGDSAQVEKVDHATAVKMLAGLGSVGRVGPSLGSFSVSAGLLSALRAEYRSELDAKSGKFDTDPHFWMPMTLPEADYVGLMGQKGVEATEAKAHHERMVAMKDAFLASEACSGGTGKRPLGASETSPGGLGKRLFGAVDVGAGALWWDYGQVKLYCTNNTKLLEDSEEADHLRSFLGVTSRQMNSSLGSTSVCASSCVFSSTTKSGSIASSVVSAVNAQKIEATGAIIVNCTAKSIVAAEGSVVYNIVENSEGGITAAEGDVLVGVMDEEGNQTVMKSHVSIDGGKAWKTAVAGNELTFEDVYKKNGGANIGDIEKVRNEKIAAVAASF